MDKTTGKRKSLKTSEREEARQLVAAKNQAERQPVLNLNLARALSGWFGQGHVHAHLAASLGCIDTDEAGRQ